MTAALPDWDIASDAELAGAAAAGDRAALGGIYDRYADRLHDFCIGMVRDRDAAADCVQEVFCTAAVELRKLREPGKLRPWLYAIARNEALRCIRLRGRENVSDELPEQHSSDAGPDTLAGRTELANLIAEAAGGLSDRDREVLELSYRHGLAGPELAEALGVTPDNATKLVSRLRETIERSLGALLVARRAQSNPQGCPELATVLADWDGHFSVLMRKRIARHIDSCATCERSRRDLVNPKALLGAVPILVAAPWWLRGQTLTRVQLTSAHAPMAAGTDQGSISTADTMFGAPTDTLDRQPTDTLGGADTDPFLDGGFGPDDESDPDSQFDAEDGDGRSMRRIGAIAVLIGILILTVGGALFWLNRHPPSVVPSVIKTPQTTPPPVPTSTPPPAQTEPSSPPPPAPASSEPPASPPPPSPTMAPRYTPTPVYTPTPRAPISTPAAVPSAQAPPPSDTPAPAAPPIWVPPMLPLPAPWTPPQWTLPKWTPPQMPMPGYTPPGMTPASPAPPSNRSGR